jgi:IS4 transposase
VSDRGYESLITFYLLAKEGRKFVIRIKDESSSTSILKHYPTPDTEEYDIDFNVILTSKNNTYVKNHWDTYKYISSYKKCGLFSEEVTELPLNLRVVRYKAVSEGVESFITVITNLSREEFTAQQIAEIYGLRWREEVGFRGIKEELGLNKMHSRNPETVKGEIYAKMTMFNLASRIRNALDKKEKKRKYIHHPSFSLICTIVKKFAFSKKIPKDIDEKILRHTIPERPGRQDLRKKKKS